MKTALKYLRYFIIAVTFLFLSVIIYLKFVLPNGAPLEEITIERTPERLQRGEYLANAMTVCVDCHSTRDWSKYAGPMDPNSIGVGGEIFN